MGLWRKRGAGGACAACLLAAPLSLAACAAPGHTEGQPPESLGPSPAEQGGAPAGTGSRPGFARHPHGRRRPGVTAGFRSAAEADEDVRWIATHPDALGADGASTQRKLLSLAATEPAARSVRARVSPTVIPPRPASRATGRMRARCRICTNRRTSAGATPCTEGPSFASTGCCPTALCMVYQGLTGKGDLTPYDMGLRAQEGGFVTEGGGTDAAFMAQQAPSLGLACTKAFYANAENLRAALFAGPGGGGEHGPGRLHRNGPLHRGHRPGRGGARWWSTTPFRPSGRRARGRRRPSPGRPSRSTRSPSA